MKALIVGLVVAAIASGSAPAATPTQWLTVRARLVPVTGTKAAGRFSGVLIKTGGGRRITPDGKVPIPPGSRWRLTWSLSLPKLDGRMTASLRIGSAGTSAHVTRPLCAGCSLRTGGIMTLSARQVTRISKGDAVVVAQTRSVRLRGPVKVSLQTSGVKPG
jgi:hypothetical protein